MANQTTKAPATATLLVELLTEELPPKALLRLAERFRDALAASLEGASLLPRPYAVAPRCLATPRRLVVLIGGVLDKAADANTETTGPPLSAGPDAAKGFARKCGVAVESLVKQQTAKGEVWLARYTVAGARLDEILAQKVDDALKKLPIPKLMRWGSGEVQFARPVHGLIMMHGSRVIPGEVLGLNSGNQTLGHRFLSGGRITIKNADGYEQALLKSGKVIADFAARRLEIINKIKYLCGDFRVAVASDALYDEITALVEAPTVYEGTFGAEFLEVPQECLVLSMQQHQRYVPLRDRKTGKLLPGFLFVSNIDTRQPREIIHGNERVLRARLADAKFFYDQDRRTRLEARVPRLASVVYHNKLGTQLDRVERIQKLAGTIANELKADVKWAERAAYLCKADLLTDMVGEFPELQGTMGRYYALHDGEPKEVADAIEAHYRPRFAGDDLPKEKVAIAVALADRLDALVGIFGIGLAPTGDKDPFALRRAALGVIRILSEHKLHLDLEKQLQIVHGNFPSGRLAETHQVGTIAVPNYVAVNWFIKERAKSYLRELGYSTLEVESVLDLNPIPAQYIGRLEAVRKFIALPEAASLAESDKRIRNIISKSQADSVVQLADESILQDDAEKRLLRTARLLRQQVDTLLESEKFSEALLLTAQIHEPVSQFFEKVMVNVDEVKLRNNRFALLHEVGNLTNRVAHIFKLAA